MLLWSRKRGGRRPADAAMCYLKADFLVTTDDRFVWSFRGPDQLTGSFPLLNYERPMLVNIHMFRH